MEEYSRSILSSYIFNDMLVNYLIDSNDMVSLELIPLGMEDEVKRDGKILRPDSLIQAKIVGDVYPGANAGGLTMHNSGTVLNMHFLKQEEVDEEEKRRVDTYLCDNSEHLFIHSLEYTRGDYALKSYCRFVNKSRKTAKLEYLTSFALGNITPFVFGEATGALNLYRIRSKWSHEGHLVKNTAEELLLEPSWVNWHPMSERFGQRGSMPVRDYAPFAAVEDSVNGVVWAASLAIESSWEMEFYRRDNALCLSGGIIDREFGQWTKSIEAGEEFLTPWSLITVCRGDVDYASQRLTHFNVKFLEKGGISYHENEDELPILFNEYCTTWGLPSHENIMNTVNAIKGHGLKYFVIDCGWFVEEGKHWGDGMGDYIPSEILFPKGLGYTADCIRESGLIPGIWYEIDNAGHDSHIYSDEEMFLKRDGLVLTTEGRHFFDMSQKKVWDYLDEKVIKLIKECDFGYIKMDYNDTIGLGCDDSDSLAEGLRKDREKAVEYVKHIKKECPDLILENCSSGGHKTEAMMMSLCDMASFSDAHECEHIPLIAAGLQRTILPRQSQIWAVIRKDDTEKRIAYTLINTLLGRMCFSGDVTELSGAQWQCIDEGIAFYKKAAPVIKHGYSYIYRNTGASEKELTGYQVVIRCESDKKELRSNLSDRALVTIHIFDKVKDEIRIELPKACPEAITDSYSKTDISVRIENHHLIITPSTSMEAMALILER